MQKELLIAPKRQKGENGHKTFSVRLREETVTKLDKLAAESGRSRNELIGMLLDFAVENCSVKTQ